MATPAAIAAMPAFCCAFMAAWGRTTRERVTLVGATTLVDAAARSAIFNSL